MLSRDKNPGKNSSDSSATPLRTGMFRSRPFTDPTVSDEVSPHKQELPDLQTQLERGARFSQSLSRMKVYGNRPAIQPKISVGAPGDKYEQEADQMAQQVMSMPAAISHPPIQRLEKQEQEEKEPVQTKALAASITPLVQRETAPEELEEDQQPVQMKRSLQETAEVSIQRDGTEAMPAVPNYQLTPPSLLQPPDPSSRYGLGQNFQLHLDPQIQAMAFQHVQQQMEPATIRAALSQVNLGLTALPAPSASGPTATPTPNPSATPSPSPAAPLVPRDPDTPRPATAGDLMKALLAVPAIDTWIMSLKTRATEQMMRDWRRLSTGEQVGAVSSAVAIGAGALAGILSDPNARQMALSQLNGRVFQVPGLNWLSLEINTGGNNLMLGGHVDIGSLLPPSLGFGPSSPQAIGGPPTPQPFVPGQPPVQRKATPEAEEEKVQMKPLANAMIQQEAMPEAAEEVQTKPSLQRAAEGGSHNASSNLESQLSSSKGGGSPLPDEVRSFMEPRFGADFSQVRVHTDSEAVQMNRELNAQAFTHKQDLYFGAGKAPGKDALTAHELTHVVQQTGGVQAQLSVEQPFKSGSGTEVSPVSSDFVSRDTIQRSPPTAAGASSFEPVVAQPKPPADVELNKEFAMPVQVSNAANAPAGTTFKWSWVDLDGKLEKGDATGTAATSSLKAKPKQVGEDSVGAKVSALTPLLPGATVIGNEVESPTTTLRIPEVEVEWGEKVTPGNTGGGKERDLASDPMKIYRNDSYTITANFKKISEPEKAGVKFAISGSGAVGGVEALPDAKWADSKATWVIKATRPGLVKYNIFGKVPGSLTELSHDINLKVVMDLQDLILTCGAASNKIAAKWNRAAKKLEDATTAFEDAQKKHKAVLKKAGQAQELVGELLMGAFFAGLGGLAGGAVGNIIKSKLGKPLADDALGGALTDGGKDVVKFATKALQKLGSGGNHSPAPTGSGGPAGSAQGGNMDGVGADPTRWARGISSKLHDEVATVQERLGTVQDKARNADRDAEFDDFDGDPVEAIDKDESITALEGVSTKEGDYAKGLWQMWLENYAYEFYQIYDKDSGATIGDIRNNVNDTLGKMKAGINEAAKQCGENGDDWIARYGGIAFAKAVKQRKQEEWKLEHPGEPLPDDLK